MKTELLRRARQNYTVRGVPVHIQRHNIKSWARSVYRLGDKWLLAQPVDRKETQ